MGALAASFREIVAAQVELSGAAQRIAAGDVSVPITARSEHDVLAQSFTQVQASLQALIAEGVTVVQAAQRGELSARGDSEKFAGAYRELVEGMNGTLAAVAAPDQRGERGAGPRRRSRHAAPAWRARTPGSSRR